MDLLTKAKGELAEIEQRIGEMLRRKNDLTAFIAAGERLFGAVSHEVESESAPRRRLSREIQTASQSMAETMQAFRQTKKDQITSAAADLLAGGVHIPARELAERISARGIDLGIDPTSTVSVLLSRDGRFKSERAKGGWTLATEPNNEETPQGAATPAGSDLLDFQPGPAEGTGTTPD